MLIRRLLCVLLFFSTLLLKQQTLFAQICVDNYFAVNFITPTVQNTIATIAPSENEILMAGNVQRANSLLQGGWLTSYSGRGTLLWSKQYYTSQYNFLNFTNIIEAGNDNYLITGNIGDVDTTAWPLIHISEYAFLMKVDKYGNIIWSKVLSNLIRPFAFSDISSITKTKDNSFVMALYYTTTKQYMVIMRIDIEGNVLWTSLLSTHAANSGYGNMKLKTLSDGNIVCAGYAKFADDSYTYPRIGYSLASFDVTNGELLWNRFYLSTDTLSSYGAAFGDVVNITEFSNHGLSFIASHADASVPYYFRKTDKVLNFITDYSGTLKNVFSYSGALSSLYASAASVYGNNNRALLMDNGDVPFMMGINTDGDIVWQKEYPLLGISQETKCIINTKNGFYFFCFTHDGGSTDPKLVKTDMLGNISCVEGNSSLTKEDVTPSFFMEYINLVFEKYKGVLGNQFVSDVHSYNQQSKDICRIACCKDVTDTAAEIKLCDVDSYTLANNDVVHNSGIYPVTFKTEKGCDSIVYYKITFNFKPIVNLGADTCFGEKDSLTLKANAGYESYTWNGLNTGSNYFGITQPGLYSLLAGNSCGMQSDTIRILKKCEFDIYMPNAFTPNGDGLNDWFRVPQNYNQSVSLAVYNRWGQKIFETHNVTKGWNGMIGSYPAPVGTYPYILIMKSLDNKKTFSVKGYVTLIR
ncbi:MAG TPA: gliding motility-associated C-terminal domain-containing protein [Parafilimonas sp.]|nr:gliding motility-associated C-terminal domain-containing protein [Parafilimonas sp.]